MKKLGMFFLVALAACSNPASVSDPGTDYKSEYLAIASIYNTAVDSWDQGDRSDLHFMRSFGQKMADATRQVEERLVSVEWPEHVQEGVDELLEAEAKAHVAFLIMAVSENLNDAEQRLVKAFEIYSGASEYSEMIRVRLGLPSVKISPHHYL